MRFLAVLFSLMTLPAAFASYIDPGTGSYIIQILVASFFSSLFFIKLYWSKLKTMFSKKKVEESRDSA